MLNESEASQEVPVVTERIGAQGVQGMQGTQGIQGVQGEQGLTGNTDNLSYKVGEVVGVVRTLAIEVANMNNELTAVHSQLATNASHTSEMSVQLNHMCGLQEIANGRTGKLEIFTKHLATRLGLLEQWRSTVTFLPRLADKLAEHKAIGLVITAIVTSAAGVAAGRFL